MAPGFNMILAIVTLFVLCLIFGANMTTLKIAELPTDYPAYQAGMREGDVLLAVDSEKVSTWTQARLKISTVAEGDAIDFKVKHENGEIERFIVDRCAMMNLTKKEEV